MITVHVSCSFCMPPRRPDVDIDIPSPNDFTVDRGGERGKHRYLLHAGLLKGEQMTAYKSTITMEPVPVRPLRFRIARNCDVDILFIGPVTREAVDKLIAICSLQRDTFPPAGEEVTEDPEEIKLHLCIAEGALKDIRKSIEAILPDSESGTATEAVQRLVREYEKTRR